MLEGKYLDKKIKILIEDVVWLEDTIWFCAQNFNSLYSMNLVTSEVRKCGEFPNEIHTPKRLFASMKLVGKKIYFIPLCAKNIVVYDIDMNTFLSIPIDDAICDSQGDMFFMGVEQYRNYLFVLPVCASKIIRLNTLDNKIDYIADWREKSSFMIGSDIYFRKQSVLIDNMLYVPFYNTNAVLELNCDTMQTTIYRLGTQRSGYTGICFDGTKFWLTPKDTKNLVQWDMQLNYTNEIELYNNPTVCNSYSYVGIVCYNSDILVFPIIKNTSESICGGKVIILDGIYSFVKEEKDYIAYYEKEQGLLTIIDKAEGLKKIIDISVDVSKLDLMRILQGTDGYAMETKSLGMKQLIGMVMEDYTTISAL